MIKMIKIDFVALLFLIATKFELHLEYEKRWVFQLTFENDYCFNLSQ